MELGVELLPSPAVVEGADAEGEAAVGAGSRAEAAGAPTTTDNSTDRPETDAVTDALVREVEFREVFYIPAAETSCSSGCLRAATRCSGRSCPTRDGWTRQWGPGWLGSPSICR